MGLTQTTVTGTFTNANGTPAANEPVSFALSKAIENGSYSVSATTTVVYTDGGGEFNVT
jgi:hypothetical protein